MNKLAVRGALVALLTFSFMLCACTSTRPAMTEGESEAVVEEVVSVEVPGTQTEEAMSVSESEDAPEEGEVPLAITEAETHTSSVPEIENTLEEVIVKAPIRERHEVIHDFVAAARLLLRDVELEYVFTGSGKKEILRGRPVVFALWSEVEKAWSIVHIEIPRPPVKWKPGGKPISFLVRTPGVEARHVKGTGAERLMFAFSKGGEPLKVYGRKFPVFDSVLLTKKKWRQVVETAKPITYLPFTEDTLDPLFVSGGRAFLLASAQRAIDELRESKAPSWAFPGQLLADVVPPEVLTTLAVIEQTDDTDFVEKQARAFEEVLSHYGLKREEAYRFSVSRANAIGPMQFTNQRGNGTYALVVRRCRLAKLDPDFERGASDLVNAMKAAVCLFDIELSQMRADIREAYRTNMKVLGIFPVAAYNGGPRNVIKLYGVMKKMGVKLTDLRALPEKPQTGKVKCPCFWKQTRIGIVPVAISKYNNENRRYVEKYQSILNVFDDS